MMHAGQRTVEERGRKDCSFYYPYVAVFLSSRLIFTYDPCQSQPAFIHKALALGMCIRGLKPTPPCMIAITVLPLISTITTAVAEET